MNVGFGTGVNVKAPWLYIISIKIYNYVHWFMITNCLYLFYLENSKVRACQRNMNVGVQDDDDPTFWAISIGVFICVSIFSEICYFPILHDDQRKHFIEKLNETLSFNLFIK